MEPSKPKYKGDLIGISEACDLLKISVPTLLDYRKKYSVSSVKVKRNIMISKVEVLQKLYVMLNPPLKKISLTFYDDLSFESLKIDDTTYDLRLIDLIDGHGAISLICYLISQINKGKSIHLLIDKENSYLKNMGFFSAIRMYLNRGIFWDESIHDLIQETKTAMIKLPIKRLGVVGAHTSLADDLTISLKQQGYSMDICSYVGWAMGELADNSATHAKSHPSFAYFEQFGEDKRYLQLTIGDCGIGIPASLRGNEKYSHLDDEKALLMAFKPYVSGRSDAEERGKGLTDVLQIAMECGSYLKVESSGVAYRYAFNQGVDNFWKGTPMNNAMGTIISILFIDGQFGSVDRMDVDRYINQCLEKI